MNGPQYPSGPQVPMSEPELEMRLAETAIHDITSNSECYTQKVKLCFVRDLLQKYGLDVDSDGFIIRTDSEEYATPYIFVEELVREHVRQDGETVIDAFFRPETDDTVVIRGHDRLHLTDLHTIVPTNDGLWHPVKDRYFELEDMYATLNISFLRVMEWSDVIRDKTRQNGRRYVSVNIESEDPLELTCFSPDCDFRGDASEWDGPSDNPTCPECGGKWDEEITVCLSCQDWHWGTHYADDTYYAEPSCPKCNAGNQSLKIQSRYESYEEA